MEQITLEPRYFLAASVTASTDEIRHSIMGVHIEPVGGSNVLLVATNGSCMTVINVPCNNDLAAPVTVGIENIKHLNKQQELTIERYAGCAHFKQDRVTYTEDLIDGFPDWRSVLPSRSSMVHQVIIDAKRLALFSRVVTMLTDKRNKLPITLSFHQLSVKHDRDVLHVLCESAPEFVGMLMPMSSKYEQVIPEWLAKKG